MLGKKSCEAAAVPSGVFMPYNNVTSLVFITFMTDTGTGAPDGSAELLAEPVDRRREAREAKEDGVGLALRAAGDLRRAVEAPARGPLKHIDHQVASLRCRLV